MKKKLLLLVLLVHFLHAKEDESAKVVFDLTTNNVAQFQKIILKGIEVHKTHYANQLKELEVAVVIHGGAYRFFVKNLNSTIYKDDKKLQQVYSDLKKRIATMSDTYDVEFLMCGSGMLKNKLEANNIVDFVKILPTSTVGLIDKQNDGYAYIPAGN